MTPRHASRIPRVSCLSSEMLRSPIGFKGRDCLFVCKLGGTNDPTGELSYGALSCTSLKMLSKESPRTFNTLFKHESTDSPMCHPSAFCPRPSCLFRGGSRAWLVFGTSHQLLTRPRLAALMRLFAVTAYALYCAETKGRRGFGALEKLDRGP